MNLKNEKGITIIALIITIILMLILVGVTVKVGTKEISKAKLEDIKTEMISIKTRAKIVKDKYDFKDIDNLVGTKLSEATDYNAGAIDIPDESKENCYIWTQEDLNSQELSSIKVDKDKFYVVYYGDDIEIYYSKGVDGKYSLTELQGE